MKALQTYLILGALLIVTIVGCEKERRERICEQEVLPCLVDSSKVHIRVKNFSGYPMCDLKIKYTNSDSIIIGALGHLDSTCYIVVDQANNFPDAEFKVGAVMVNKNLFNGFYDTYEDEKTFITYHISIREWIDTAKFNKGIIDSEWIYDISTRVDIYP